MCKILQLQKTALCADAQTVSAVQSFFMCLHRNSKISRLRVWINHRFSTHGHRVTINGVPVDVHKTAPCTWRRIVWWSICTYANEYFLEFLCICVDSPMWCVCECTQNRCVNIRCLPIYANENFLACLRICADFSIVEFMWMYAKKMCATIRCLLIYSNEKLR